MLMLAVLQDVPLPTADTNPWAYIAGVFGLGYIAIIAAVAKSWSTAKKSETTETTEWRLRRIESDIDSMRQSAHIYRDTAQKALGSADTANAFIEAMGKMMDDNMDEVKRRLNGLEERERLRG